VLLSTNKVRATPILGSCPRLWATMQGQVRGFLFFTCLPICLSAGTNWKERKIMDRSILIQHFMLLRNELQIFSHLVGLLCNTSCYTVYYRQCNLFRVIAIICYLTTLSVSGLYSVDERMIKEYGALSGLELGRRNRSTRIKPAPMPLCPQQHSSREL
jgi:hypothetical protein